MFLVLLLIAILPLKNHPIWTGSGGIFSSSKIVGAGCCLYVVIHIMNRGRWPQYLGTWQARLFSLFALLAFISYQRTDSPSASFYILTLISMLLLCFTVLTAVDSLKRLRWVVLSAVGSLGWASLYVLREWQKNRGWATGYRGAWVVGDENHFAVSAICGITLAWFMAQQPGSTWERWFCRTCMTLTTLALLVSASRGGLLGLVPAMLFCVARSPHRARNFVAVLGLLVGFNVLYSRSPLQRLLHPTIYDQGSQNAHLASWQAGINMIRDHPIAGIGVSNFKWRMHNYAPDWWDGADFMAHNAYISVGAELGIPGLLLFLAILIATFVNLERTYRNRLTPPLIRRTAVALQAGLIGCAISISFISAELHEHVWFIVALSMCLPPLARRAQARTITVHHDQDFVPAGLN